MLMDSQSLQKKCHVFSRYMGAWSLKKGLAQLGITLHNATGKEGLIEANSASINENDTLFFTEEKSLKKYYISDKKYHFYPQKLNIEIDNKLIFAEWLRLNGEFPVPFLFQCISADPFNFPIYVKAKHSWVGDREMPKGYICNNQQELESTRERIKKIGLKYEHFFFQDLIEGDITHTYSTCGFFDYEAPSRNFIIVQQKCLGTGKKITTSTITQTIKDPENLIKRTESILNQLKFKGPFELEFIYDCKTQTYFVLELNPRFWMQHGVFIDFYQNYVIRCYLDMDEKEDRERLKDVGWLHVIWVDTFTFFIHPLRAFTKLYSLKDKNSKIVFYPSFLTAMKKIIKCWDLHTCTMKIEQ